MGTKHFFLHVTSVGAWESYYRMGGYLGKSYRFVFLTYCNMDGAGGVGGIEPRIRTQ